MGVGVGVGVRGVDSEKKKENAAGGGGSDLAQERVRKVSTLPPATCVNLQTLLRLNLSSLACEMELIAMYL